MDDRRFDSLTRAFASSTNRRTLIKTLLGLGGAAAIGTVAGEETDAATRPTPTPKPVTCPGQQTWNGSKCVCPATLSQCVPNGGPACCNDKLVAPGAPGYSTCCDNACCAGTCTSEEICCATNRRSGEQAPTNRVCKVAGKDVCCLYSDECCTVDGCCSTTCTGGADGKSYCCAANHWCPGGSTSAELCCQGTTVCCGANTNGNICADLSHDNNNCGACGNVCGGCSSCQNGVCVADNAKCTLSNICCPKNGSFICEPGPYCGCDRDSDCPGTNPATCQVGWCDRGTCKIKAAPPTTVCHPAGSGANSICDPAVMCNGESQSCPGPHYAQPGTDCGDCKICNATGICTAKCSAGQDCCPASDKCVPHGATCCTADSQCTAPCQTCNEDLGYCVTTCTAGQACCTLGDGPECCATTGGSMCCANDGCVDSKTDNNNCGQCGHVCPGCSTCQNGLCTATNSKCTGEGQVCCKNGNTYTCEAGPYCGCDTDGDCSNLNNPASCQVGKCDHSGAVSVCVTAPAPSNTVCHPAGASATCDPAVMCSGVDQACPGPNYASNGTVCGACLECNGQGLCLAQCTEGEQCCQYSQPVGNVCIPSGKTCCNTAEECTSDCEVCNQSLHYCISRCDPATEKCCPGTDHCVPSSATCCGSDRDCVGPCEVCNLDFGYCVATCTAAEQCCQFPQPVGDVCVPNDKTCCNSPEACFGDCEICNVALHYCISACDSGDEKCCPGTDNCVPGSATCCDDDDDCSDLDYCDGLIWHNFSCGQGGYCVDTPVDCNDGNLCANDFCDATTGCSNTPVTCTTPPACFTGPGTCDPTTGQCSYTPVVCDVNQCLTCVDSQCVTICPAGTHCDGEGGCVSDCNPGNACDDDGDCCGDNLCCDGICVTPDSECGQCLSTCTGASKCCCYHPDNGNYDCANVNGCDNGEGHYCIN